MGLSDLRRHHLSMVLRHLVRHGPCSRTVLAQQTGLTKATVSALVADLLGRKLVQEQEIRPGRTGRPSVDVGVSSGSVGALALQIEANRISACIMDLCGAICGRRDVEADFHRAGPQHVLGQARTVIAAALADAAKAGLHCAGATIAVPGLVDPITGALFVAPNLHWLDVDLTDPALALGLPAAIPVTIDNEANLGALAELRYRSGDPLASFVYLSGGVGVGGGIVVDGHLLRGAHGFAGEIGHIVVEPGGRQCACGNRGCLETVVGVGRRATVQQRAQAIAGALHSVVQLMDPDAIILGGSFIRTGSALARRLAEQLQKQTIGGRWHPCEVRVSTLGSDAALIGAATAALDQVIADPTAVPIGVPARPSTRSA